MSYIDLLKGKEIVACDTETTGLMYHGSYADYGFYPSQPFAFSFTSYEGKNWYVSFPVDPFTRRVMYERNIEKYYLLNDFFRNDKITKVFHNSNFDISIMERVGIATKGNVIDTMILAHLENVTNPVGLKPLCKMLFNIGEEDQKDLIASVNKARRVGKKKGYMLATDELGFGKSPNKADYWLGDPALCKEYAVTDTDRTMGLYWAHEERYMADEEYRNLCDVEHQILDITRGMQDIGIRLDVKKIDELLKYYSDIISEQQDVKADMGYGDLNPRSSKQMKEVFYTKLKLDPVYKDRKDKETGDFKKTLTTDTDTLSKWASKVPLAKCLIEISACEHQLSTFIKPFRDVSIKTDEGMILRPSYRSVGAVTGRISCSKPNLMNIASNDSIKKVSDADYRARECFIPREGYTLVFLDYSQVEVWITAYLSGDKVMIEYLESGGDLHGKTGEACFGKWEDYEENKKMYRKKGKTLNFGSIYGMGPSKIADSIECSQWEAEDVYEKFWSTYSDLSGYNQALMQTIKETGHVINPFGRVYWVQSNMAYRGLNYMVQGSASEVMKRAMINTHQFLKGKDARILLTIHDELCIEVSNKIMLKPFAKQLVKCMQGNLHEPFGMPNKFGVDVEYTKTHWADKKELTL